MKPLHVANDIVPVGEFKVQVAKFLKNLKETGRPLVITQNGKPAGVLLAPEDYDELVYTKSFLDSINRGLVDGAEGRIFLTEELKDKLKKQRE